MRKLLGKPGASPYRNIPGSSQHDGGNGGVSDNDDHHQPLRGQYGSSSHLDGPSTTPAALLYRPNARQDASYQVGVPIAALDKSPDGRAAVLAGRHVLKTVRVERSGRHNEQGVDIQEAFDLRALITAQSSSRASATASVAEQLSIRDVKWGTGRSDTHIYTACLRGKIFQYDLSHLGSTSAGSSGDNRLGFVQTQEESRQINTLDINPHNDTYLLSGSQDGVVRCFDTRFPLVQSRFGPTFRPMKVFNCNADVRAVQWSPRQAFYFACCTEQGVVMKWDIRKPTSPVLRVTAHVSACSSLSWHPDGEHLVSGGIDKTCHVWDFSKSADKRQKPKWTVHVPAAVAAVAWRPGQWSATCQGLRAAQIAVSYDVSGPKRPGINAAHVWDLARPTIPYKTIERFECSPSALLWRDQEFLWTVGEDGLFCQNDVTFAPRVLDRTAVSTLGFSATGDVLTFLDVRPPLPRPRVLASVHRNLSSATAAAAAATAVSSSYSSDPTTGAMSALSVSRSDSEDDVVSGFLLPRRRNQGRRRRTSSVHHLMPSPSQASPRSNVSFSTDKDSFILTLEDSLRVTGHFRPQQIMAIGHAPSAAHKETYAYMAQVYLETLNDRLPTDTLAGGAVVPLPDRIAAILDTYARAAEITSQFRLAQVWRVLAFAMDLLFQRRGQYHRERRAAGAGFHATSDEDQHDKHHDDSAADRIRGAKLLSSDPSESIFESKSVHGHGLIAKEGSSKSAKDAVASRAFPVRSLLAEVIESTSNMPTPLARPVTGIPPDWEEHRFDGSRNGAYNHIQSYLGSSPGSQSIPPDMDSFSLPPARYHEQLAKQPRPQNPVSSANQRSSEPLSANHFSSIEGYDFYDTEAMTSAIDVPGANAGQGSSSMKSHAAHAHYSARDDNSPLSTPQLHRQDSTDSAAGRIFEISQTSGYALDGSDPAKSADPGAVADCAGGNLPDPKPSTHDSRGRGRYVSAHRGSMVDDESVSRSHSRPKYEASFGKPSPLEREQSLISSVGSSQRLLRLNRALLSMEWGESGSDLNPSLSAPSVTRDTYYQTNAQDSESSINSAPTGAGATPSAAGRAADRHKHPTNSFTNKRPILRRSASSRQETASLATTELLAGDSLEDDEDSSKTPTELDYLPWPHDPPFPFATNDVKDAGMDRDDVLNPYVIVERALSFEVRSSPLNASAMVLLLQPLVPDNVVDALQARAILKQHHARLMGMQLFQEAALLRKLCVPGWPAKGVRGRAKPDKHVAALSKWGAGTGYKSIFAPAQKNVTASFICSKCKQPREDKNSPAAAVAPEAIPVESLWQCTRCKSTAAPCAVCGHRNVAAGEDESGTTATAGGGGDKVLSTWWYCVGCSHGGHLSCLEGWHAHEQGGSLSPRIGSGSHGDYFSDAGAGTKSSGSCCPLDGCGHVCLPGRMRGEDLTKSAINGMSGTEGEENTLLPGSREPHARPDIQEAAPSHGHAADAVREPLPSTRSELAGPRTILSSSPGQSSIFGLVGSGGSGGSAAASSHLVVEPRERERRKSVKFAGTDEW
ncbi:SEA (Seh1-associated) complex subunit [Sporothrix epigloea]|uniref:SEA (Seh1-associated) complex subunit n=1 Tax=Sporothrix epigloea TaxID=1892477 RepID=A0ABP0DU23_9PEZI